MLSMEGSEVLEPKSRGHNPHLAIRCARAAILLAKLNSLTSCRLRPAGYDDQEKEKMQRKVEGLMMDLARERKRTRKIKLCIFMELTLQVLVVLSVFFLVLVLKFS